MPQDTQNAVQPYTVREVQIAHHGRCVHARVYQPAAPRAPAVIFCHGFNGSGEDFSAEASLIAERGRCAVTFTFCGSGVHDKSSFPSTEMTLFTEREDLFAVMDYVRELPQCGDVVLFGGSQGGAVAVLAAAERKVKGLVLLFPALCIPDDWNARYPTDEGVPAALPLWGVTLGARYVFALRGLDLYAEMPAQNAPVLIFHGDRDEVVPLAYSERAAARYPACELTVLHGQGHGFPQEVMRQVMRRVLPFLDQL